MEARHHNLIRAIAYLQHITDLRLSHHFSKKKLVKKKFQFPEFKLEESEDLFTRFLSYCEFSIEEFITLMCALVPHVVPNFFERIVAKHLSEDGQFPEFGGHRSGNNRSMIPTVSTILFILAGDDLSRRLELLEIFDSEHAFAQQHILSVDEGERGEPFLNRRILMDSEYVELFTKGRISLPMLSTEFPAELLQTDMEWDDLILQGSTQKQLDEIELWLRHNDALMEEWGLKKKIKPGYRALFYGPPGTGKTLAASLIGKYADRPIFRVDLSKVVSKYIGETEKNLANLFDKAENKDWILFFDEADACFGKRSSTKDAKDRYANQEIAYLLQRIENYNGLIIMATNFKNNMDEAFLRRFNATVYFPKPRAEERLQLWEKSIPGGIQLDTDVDLTVLATTYELTGSHIMGAIHHACLKTREANSQTLVADVLLQGIGRELAKEGKRM
ncbi:MAG: ATP-binding protein [Bacteroidota bacterium]